MTIPNRAGLSAFSLNDEEYEESVITEVTEAKDGEWYSLTMGSSGISIRKAYDGHSPHGIVPKAGDTLRTYGRLGFVPRGMAINGVLLYWHTPEEEKEVHRLMVEKMQAERREKFEKDKPDLDAQYDALPEIFRKRIDRFRANNPDFRWLFESYELFCCTEAVKLATHLGSAEAVEHYCSLTQCSITKEKERWYREWDEQKTIDKAAGISGDHSGNTHGMMATLAFLYVKEPEFVAKLHGSLSPLVGSWAYGDMPPDKA